MKKIILGLSLIAGVFSFIQCSSGDKVINEKGMIKGNGIEKRETRKLEGYNEVKLKGNFDVVLTHQAQDEIVIEAEENIIPLIETKLNGKTLELGFKPYKVSFKKAVVYVPAEGVDALSLIGSGDIENEGVLKAENITISLRGSGDIYLKNLQTQKANVYLQGSGNIGISGVAKEMEATLQGSGDISAFDFIIDKANVFLLGSGDIEVFANKEFSGILKGSGGIKVKGKPNITRSENKGSGSFSFL